NSRSRRNWIGYVYGSILVSAIILIAIISVNQFYASLTDQRGHEIARSVRSRASVLEEIAKERPVTPRDLKAVGIGAREEDGASITYELLPISDKLTQKMESTDIYRVEGDSIVSFAVVPSLSSVIKVRFGILGIQSSFRRLLS